MLSVSLTQNASPFRVKFYKDHRAILSSDIIHVRRADHHGPDGILHVNPKLQTKGLAVIYNPTAHPINTTLPLSLYYTGLTASAQVPSSRHFGLRQSGSLTSPLLCAQVSEQGGAPVHMPLARDFTVELELNIAARNVTWYTFE